MKSRWALVVIGTVLLTAPPAVAVDSATVDGQVVLPTAAQVNTQNMVVNGTFERGLGGWKTNHPDTQSLQVANSSHLGAGAAALSTTTFGTVVINNEVNTVHRADADTA